MKVRYYSTIVIVMLVALQSYSQKAKIESVGKENNLATANLFHIVMYGQSLMLGTSSTPLLTIQAQYNTLMFHGGVRSGYDEPLDSFYNGLSPLVEKIVRSPASGAQLGETPASGFSETFINLMIRESKFHYNEKKRNFDNRDFCLLISSPAQGSTSAKNLSAPGKYWDRFKTDIINGRKQADALGKIYNVPCILWNQGERDIDNSTPPEEYKQQLVMFQQEADKFIKSVTGQTNTVAVILYQTVSHNVRKTKNYIQIANAQYELAKSNPYITMSNTTYQLPYYTDHVHFSNTGSKWNGANHAIAAKRIIIDKADWRPVYVKKITSGGNDILLDFNVPVPPLVFDEKTVTNPGHYGFSVFDNAGESVAIQRVEIVSGNQIKIALTGKVEPGQVVWYGNNGTSTGAQNGARGNLRDSQGDLNRIRIGDSNTRLDNWAPIFKEIIP